MFHIISHCMIDCIITGSGAEYGGSRSFSASKKKCKSWNRKYKLDNTKVRKLNLDVIQIITKKCTYTIILKI